ncbi:baseplate J/gp47 family protein [Shouchella lehensis]|uniref:baseplate J/gp47 family protein n=1 Tax=Shouchella lehensis TaxID=300825 RepID=UPI001FB9D3BD|nr:baseplate J/gp47 family protein [Shouchella lehensis]
MTLLNEKGFQKKTYVDLLDEMDDKAKELFGQDVNTSVRSPLGIILRIVAFMLSGLWEIAERVYQSGFISKSEDVQLDRLAANYGIVRAQASESFVTIKFTGEPNHKIEEFTRYATESGIEFRMIDEVVLNQDGLGEGRAISVEKGSSVNVAAGTVTVQAEPHENVHTLTNPESSDGGQNRETDQAFKERLALSVEGSSSSTIPGIVATLKEVPGVRSANVIINNTMLVDDYGNPPKSVHCYVLGGSKDMVAEAIFNSVGAGIETVGEEIQEVTDISGLSHDVFFDMAEEIKIYVRLTIRTNAAFPLNGMEQLKNHVVYTIGGTDQFGVVHTGSQMGADVIISRLYNAVYKVEGLDDISIQIGTEKNELGTGNIEIQPRQVAQVLFSDIEVV